MYNENKVKFYFRGKKLNKYTKVFYLAINEGKEGFLVLI